MAAALEVHDSILSTAVADGGGHVLKTTGDGILAVFESPTDAIVASIEAQRALERSSWDETGPLRVRMGLHTGEAQSRADDFFGPTLNRAARIMAAGHGGQVLVSGATALALDGLLPDHVSLRDLGQHRLKDLTDPEHLFQLDHPDIARGFADLLTLDARPNNLPRQPTEFLGRVDEMAAIQVMLESAGTRLLTLFGPGGAGKTRLALQVAAEQVNRFRDGVYFVDLSTERDPGAAFETIVRTLDLPVATDRDPLEVLKTRLRDRHMLLVLDNFEQLMTAAAGVGELIQACPQLEIIVTSRETLRVRAERVFPVPPLSMPDPRHAVAELEESEAVQLFLDRARSVRPDFALDEESGPIVAEICLRLDGLPLAIELAAARLNVLTPTELLGRLRDRLDVLGSGGRDLPDRQRTLWGAIGWSYELLDADECQIFELISVFSGASLQALELVASSALGIETTIDLIAGLVDKSLVRPDTSGSTARYSMLLMIREFAETKLAEAPDRERLIKEAHASYFSTVASSLRGRLRSTDRESALADLEADIGNLRTAWRYWIERADLDRLFQLLDVLWALHDSRGWYHSAIELARDMLDVLASAEPSPELAGEELALRSSLARALMAVRGYDIEVEEAFKATLELSKASGSAAQQFPVMRALSTYYLLSADLPAAAAMGQQILDLGISANDETMEIEGHHLIGSAVGFGQASLSLAHLEEVIERYDPVLHGSSRFRLGPNTGVAARIASAITLWICGDVTKGVARADDALEFARNIDHPFSIAYATYHKGFLSLLRGRHDDCHQLALQLREVASEHGYAIWETLATVLEGASLSGLGQTEEGLAKTEAGIVLYQGLTPPPIFWPFLLGVRATVHARAGRIGDAMELVENAMGISLTEEEMLPWLPMAKADLILELPEPDHDAAASLYEVTIAVASQLGLDMVQLQALTRLVALRRELGVSPDGTDELAALFSSIRSDRDEPDLLAAATLLG